MRRCVRRKRRAVSFRLPALFLLTCLGILSLARESAFAQSADATAAQAAQEKPAPEAKQDTAPQAPPAPQAEAPVISEIVVVGNKILNPTSIIAASGHKVGDPDTEDVRREMTINLLRTGNYGMHSADPTEGVKVYSVEINPPNKQRRVFIEVDENDAVNFVQILGSGPIKIDEIRPLLHFTEKQSVFNVLQLERDILDIQDLYRSRGFIVTPGQDTGMDPNTPNALNISLVVMRVAEIKIVKNNKTRRHVILREMRTKEGDFYNTKTFEADIRRLFNLDIFEDVIPAENVVSPGSISLTLSVPEKRTGIISAGIGFSNRQQLIGRAEIADTNFRGMGQTLNLLWETGGAVNRNSVVLGFTEPWLDRRHTQLNVQLYDRTIFRFANSLQNSFVGSGSTFVGSGNRYNEQRTGATITLSRPIRESYNAAISARAENVRTHALNLTPVNTTIIQNGPIGVLSGTLLHNTRDLDIDPISGNLQSVSVTAGQANLKPLRTADGSTIPGVFGNVRFAKGVLDLRQYFSLSGPRRKKLDEDKSSVALRLAFGSAVGTLPFFEQFFVGGAESLRGYREDRFWGRHYLLGSVELRQPLARKVKGVLFMDVGDAWGGPYEDTNLLGFTQSGFQLRTGVGLGLRVNTPIGPLRLDFGFGSEGGRTHFSIGNAF